MSATWAIDCNQRPTWFFALSDVNCTEYGESAYNHINKADKAHTQMRTGAIEKLFRDVTLRSVVINCC